MRRSTALAARLVTAILFSMVEASAADDFMCYTARVSGFHGPRDVALTDALETGPMRASRATRVCSVATVAGNQATDPSAARTSYVVRALSRPTPGVRQTRMPVTDALGSLMLDATKTSADYLLVPAAGGTTPPADPGSYFTCYAVRVSRGTSSFPSGQQVTVADSFAAKRTLTLVAPKHFCTPVDVDGHALETPEADLVCYSVRAPRPVVSGSSADAFGSIGVPRRQHELCLRVSAPAGSSSTTTSTILSSTSTTSTSNPSTSSTTTTIAQVPTTTSAAPTTTTSTVTSTTATTSSTTTSTTTISTTTTTFVNPSLVGFLPGVQTARDVSVDAVSGLAYVTSDEFGLSVVDVTNPQQPTVLGAANPAFTGSRVAVGGSLAVVTAGSAGLKVVDVSVPTAPRTVGSLTGSMAAVAMAGHYAYALLTVPGNPAHIDLIVVDVSVPTAPAIVGQLASVGGSEIKVAGSFAYIPAGSVGLQVVNVSNPAAPTLVRTVSTPAAARAIAVANGRAYLAATSWLQVFDLSSPSNPSVMGSLSMSSATAVALGTGNLHVLDGTGLKIVDVSNPAAPVLRSSSASYGAQHLDAAGTTAYLPSPQVDGTMHTAGLYTVDASVPTSPHLSGNAYTASTGAKIAVAGDLATVLGPSTYGMKVVDVSVATAPRAVGSVSGSMAGVAMAGHYAYALFSVAGNPPTYDLWVIDLASPAAPVTVGQLPSVGGGDIKVAGSFLYIGGSGTLQVVDVSNPAAPSIAATVTLPSANLGRALAIANGHAFVSTTSAVHVIDIGNPTSPFVVTSIGGPSIISASAVSVSNGKLCVLDATQLKIFDVSNPLSPVLRSTTTAYGAQGMDAAGTLVFLATPAVSHADPTGGVYVVDASDPTAPHLLEQLIVPGTVRPVVASGGFVYVGDGAASLDVIAVN
jgi:hypothetical protein